MSDENVVAGNGVELNPRVDSEIARSEIPGRIVRDFENGSPTIETESLRDFADREGRAIFQRSSVTAHKIVAIAIAGPPTHPSPPAPLCKAGARPAAARLVNAENIGVAERSSEHFNFVNCS